MKILAIDRGIKTDAGFIFEPFKKKPEYGLAYFDEYTARGKTSFGIALNSLRVGLVSKYLESWEPLLDIGIGDGAFIRARGEGTYGYDINTERRHETWCDILGTIFRWAS